MIYPTASSNFFLQLLKRAKHGSVQLTLPNDVTESFGDGPLLCHVQVKNWNVFDALVLRGDLGLADAIIEGDMVVDDVAMLVEWACRNDQALGSALQGKWYGILMQKIKHILAANSRRGAKKNIMAHYDLGNEFYRLWLDPSMTYSSAIFEDGQTSLEKAQQAKYDRLIEQLEIKSSDHVLEIGCGWGGFFSRAIEKTGCKVTAVMNSPQQSRHNQELIQSRGMKGQVDLRQIDYRDIEGKFDKIVSIEMVEAVGEAYWNTYFGKVSSSLKDKGSAVIQGITIRDDLFYSYRKGTDFIQKYVFPGGMLLTQKTFEEKGRQHRLPLSDSYVFPQSYAQTLKIWRKNFQKARADVLAMGFDEKFIRMWDLYLAYCEGAFRAERISVGQFKMSR